MEDHHHQSDEDALTATTAAGFGTDAGAGTSSSSSSAPAKRTRILLSCGACRASKLKCDRAVPCGQCRKKGRGDRECVYAPPPPRRDEKKQSARNMAARLRKLEGLVREMVGPAGGSNKEDGDGDGDGEEEREQARGAVVQSSAATSYVGGTHFAAIMEDLEDLKNYFEESDTGEEGPEDPYEKASPSELLLSTSAMPKDKTEMLSLLPEKGIMDRLMNRYFNSNTPSQHIVHIPTFSKQYAEFLQNPMDADLHWIALLFMILALGTFVSTFQAPHELAVDSPVPAMTRFRAYRGAAGQALIWGRYAQQPGRFTLAAFLLYVEAEFLTGRGSQMPCYLLCGTLGRLMLRVGLHRDAAKLGAPGPTPYEGEMRRRLWHLAVQIDLLVAFHLGLPALVAAAESDTALPRNLRDEDFGEDSAELPPPRPADEYTPLSYPVNKARIARVFGMVARQAHALTLPSYGEVLRIDEKLRQVWAEVPLFLKPKPLDACVADPPMLPIQRFGLHSLYQKTRCVLHRRFLVEPGPKKEHEYSRQMCLEAAMALLEQQSTLYEATRPGGMLAQHSWFVAFMGNDFLLAGMVVALVVQSSSTSQMDRSGPSRDEMVQVLKRSYAIWQSMAAEVPDCRKSANVLRGMLRRTGISVEEGESKKNCVSPGFATDASHGTSPSTAGLSIDGNGDHPSSSSGLSSSRPSTLEFGDYGMVHVNQVPVDNDGFQDQGFDGNLWASMMPNGYDWTQFDNLARAPMDAHAHPAPQLLDQSWLAQDESGIGSQFSELMAPGAWEWIPPQANM